MNYLKFKMKEAGLTNQSFSSVLGMSLSSFYKRTQGKVEWTAKEMKIAKDVLNLSNDEFNLIFGF